MTTYSAVACWVGQKAKRFHLLMEYIFFLLIEIASQMLSSCPIAGEYTGTLPDMPLFCAKLSSDCNNPDVMFYTVSNCKNVSEIYEGMMDSHQYFTLHCLIISGFFSLESLFCLSIFFL